MFQKKKSGTGTKKKKKKGTSSTSGSGQSPSPGGKERRRRSTSQDRVAKPLAEVAGAGEEKGAHREGEDVEVDEILKSPGPAQLGNKQLDKLLKRFSVTL